MFSKYYKKSRQERLDILKNAGIINQKSYQYLLDTKVLDNDMANNMVENQLSIYGLPYGVAVNFLINNKQYVIPMVTEEPSVIAAASNAAKIIKNNGGFRAYMDKRIMIGHIALYDISVSDPIGIIESNKQNLINLANMSHSGITKLNGGAIDIKCEFKDEFLVVYLYVDVIDAMGANILNTMLESISIEIEKLIDAKKLMGIISNYCTSAVVVSECKILMDKQVAEKIEMAYKFACTDVYRAVTHNKGILNGIDALAIAIGNDTRAIEASLHSYASRSGKYMPLSSWKYDGKYLNGRIEIAIPISTVGGSIGLCDITRISLEMLDNPNSKQISMIAASLGLAQNFAALNALVTDGIQKGHMKLHARTICKMIGAKESQFEKIIEIMGDKIEINNAKQILEKLNNGCL